MLVLPVLSGPPLVPSVLSAEFVVAVEPAEGPVEASAPHDAWWGAHRPDELLLRLREMGGTPYYYFVDEATEPHFALTRLRRREFAAGRYRPGYYERTGESWFSFTYRPDEKWPAPGPAHTSIEEALEASQEEGTCSILDIQRISTEPEFLAACVVDNGDLKAVFGTAKPSRQLLLDAFFRDSEFTSAADDFIDEINRGEARAIPFFSGDALAGWFFCGYSVD